MPSFLFNDQFPSIQPYTHPSELMIKAGMYRDEKFKEGLRNIRSKYDNLLSLQLTNPGNQQFVRSQLNAAVDQLDKYTTADLSLPENVGAISSVFDPVTDDQGVLNDLAFTQHNSRQKALIEKLTIDHPDQVNPANVFPILQAEQQYRSGSRTANPNFVNFEPYYNYEKGDDEFLSKLKEDVFSDPEVIYKKDPVTGQRIGFAGEREVKQIAKQRIAGALNNSFDARKLRQMQLDYNYNVANGMYNAQTAMLGIDQDINNLKPKIADARQKLTSLVLNPTDTKELQDIIATGENELNRLGKLRERLLADPSASSEYYTFGKFMSDYVTSKADQYSYKQQGAFNLNEIDKMNYDYQLDTYLETLKAKLDVQKEQAKSKAALAIDSTTGKQEDGSYAYEPPLKKILDRISTTGNAQVDWQGPEIIPMLGNAMREKDGNILYLNTGGGDGDPAKRIYIREGKETLDPTGAQVLNVNNALGTALNTLRKMNPGAFQRTQTVNPAGPWGGNPTNINVPFTEQESINYLSELYNNYLKDPESNVRARYKPVFEKLRAELESNGIGTLDQHALGNYNNFINSDKGRSLMDVGILLNKDSKGKYEFVPDGTNNVVRLSEGKMGVSGFIALTNDDLERIGLLGGGKRTRLIEQGVLTAVPPDTVYTEDKNGKAIKSVPDRYWMSVVLPVNGELTDINDKIFEAGDLQNIELKARYRAKKMQAAAFKEYKTNSDFGTNQLIKTSDQTFKPIPGGELDTRVNEVMKALNSNPRITPEQSRAIQDTYKGLLSTPQTKADLINNIGIFIQNANGLLNSVNKSSQSTNSQLPQVTGDTATDIKNQIVYNESRGNYSLMNPDGVATGKYQFRWSFWKDKIADVTGIRNQREFLNNPMAQDAFYAWYEQNSLLPGIERIRKYNNQNLTDVQLGRLIHYRGEKGAADYLLGKVPDRPEPNNPSISEYLNLFNTNS